MEQGKFAELFETWGTPPLKFIRPGRFRRGAKRSKDLRPANIEFWLQPILHLAESMWSGSSLLSILIYLKIPRITSTESAAPAARERRGALFHLLRPTKGGRFAILSACFKRLLPSQNCRNCRDHLINRVRRSRPGFNQPRHRRIIISKITVRDAREPLFEEDNNTHGFLVCYN